MTSCSSWFYRFGLCFAEENLFVLIIELVMVGEEELHKNALSECPRMFQLVYFVFSLFCH